MLSDMDYKRFIIIEILFLILSIIIAIVFNNIMFIQYKSHLVSNNASVIGSIIESHPELEEEIIESLIQHQNKAEGEKILSYYGMDKIDYLDSLSHVSIIKKNGLFYNLVLISFIFIILTFIYYFFIKRQYRKIDEITNYMNHILNGNYALDIKDYEEGVISNLKNDIYRVTVILKNQREKATNDKKKLENVLSDISHQLKTPLTSMYVINDLLYDDTMDSKIRGDFLHKNRVQLERIEWLVTSLLKISRLDSGTIQLKREEVNIENLIKKSLEPISIALELKGQTVEINGNPNLTMFVDLNWTSEALLNILKNAHEHSFKNGIIKINYTDNVLYTCITITDYGEGILEKDLPHIFKRFYKSTKTHKESIGIGLNMAFMIIRKQDGDLNVTSSREKGTTFTIKFYKSVI